MLKQKSKLGFTLIELLVVISVIGLLASVIMISLNSVRARARDAQRKAALKQLRTAIELYFDANNSYPSTSGILYSSEPGDNWSNGLNDNGAWIPGLIPTFISKLPRDPLGGNSTNPACTPFAGRKRAYLYISNGNSYFLLAHCSPENTWDMSDSFYDPIRPTWAWKVCANQPYCQ